MLVVLGAALVSFAPARLPATHVESIAVNIVTDTDKSQMTQGHADAPKQETQKPFAEKIDEQKPVDNPAAKIAPKEVTASTDAAPPPSPPEPKQAAKKKAGAQARPDRRSAQEGRRQEGRAEEGGREEADAKVPTPPKRPPQPQNAAEVRSAARCRRCSTSATPQRKEATGDTISDTASLGAPRGTARAALAERARRAAGAARAVVESAGRRAESRRARGYDPNPPEARRDARRRRRLVMTSGQSPLFMASRDSAIRAVFRGPAVRHAPARNLRSVEGHRGHVRSARHDPRADAELRMSKQQ